jgi:hypothetical protein
MPFQTNKDAKGQFIRWGERGTKYYYDAGSNSSMLEAFEKARRQQESIEIAKARKQNGF